MSDDKQLLEWAAKAFGFGYADSHDKWVVCVPAIWKPLDNNGQAFELAVKLHLCLLWPYETKKFRTVGAGQVASEHPAEFEILGTDPYAATRRAIVRAAAAIGKEMP